MTTASAHHLDRINACNRWNPKAFRPFSIAGQSLGYVRHALAERLAAFPAVFRVSPNGVSLNESLATPESRTRTVAETLGFLAESGEMPPARGEMFPVLAAWGLPELMQIDRGWVPAFGTMGFGVHVNGIVRRPDGLYLWIGRRSLTKKVAPGQLDNLVAGGQPAGLSCEDNLVKECAEEAGIPEALARQARPASCITYRLEAEGGMRSDVLFCYDLELPESFVPQNADGEVEEFQLWSIEKVESALKDRPGDFKFNVPLVILDFLLRMGRLRPDMEPNYIRLVKGLRAFAPELG